MTEAELDRFALASIAKGSTSFSAAARLFDPATRRSVVLLYSWCRHCDDVVDGQDHGSAARRDAAADRDDARRRLEALERDTAAAFAGCTEGLHPSFAALAAVARRHAIPEALAREHLAGFRMDVDGAAYETRDDLMLYCWRVAGVVGVMMARIVGVRDADTLGRAGDLGLAFQLTNIARDVVDDARSGRAYVPREWLDAEGLGAGDLVDLKRAASIAALRERLVAEAEPYYRSARVGVSRLPRRSAWAIATALEIYRQIGVKLVHRGEAAFAERVSTTSVEKAALMAGAGWTAVSARNRAGERPPELWSAPG